MNVSELEQLASATDLHDKRGELCVYSEHEDQSYGMSIVAVSIIDTADVVRHLARRVIAAERLVGALQTARDYVSDAHIGCLVYDDGKRVSETMTTEDISLIDAALTEYEATK